MHPNKVGTPKKPTAIPIVLLKNKSQTRNTKQEENPTTKRK